MSNAISRLTREEELLKEKYELWSENERLRKELDKIHRRVPDVNPISLVCFKATGLYPQDVGIENIEIAHYKGTPAYIFDVKELDKNTIAVLSFLADEEFSLHHRPSHLNRPFPLEHSGQITVCAGIPDPALEYYLYMVVEPADIENWDVMYEFTHSVAIRCIPRWLARNGR